MPGMFQSFDAYLRPGAMNEKSIAFQLLDAGWDVWIGNNRGTIYSEGKNKKPFEWTDQASHDLPNFLQVILINSQYEKIDYIGYALGAT